MTKLGGSPIHLVYTFAWLRLNVPFEHTVGHIRDNVWELFLHSEG